jgi:predicted S18 family serine protease
MMAKYYKSSTRRKIILNMRSVCSVSSSKPHSFSSGTWEAEVGPSLEFEANMVYREISRTAKATQANSVSNNNNNETTTTTTKQQQQQQTTTTTTTTMKQVPGQQIKAHGSSLGI